MDRINTTQESKTSEPTERNMLQIEGQSGEKARQERLCFEKDALELSFSNNF